MVFIPAIGVTPPVLPTVQPVTPSIPTVGGAGSAQATTGFSNALTGAVDNLTAVQGKADNLAVQAATGTLQNPHDYLIAATEASLTTQMTVAVRNKAIEAFNEIMRMPL
jgi:flagellar hook-basal body complex protein FliE